MVLKLSILLTIIVAARFVRSEMDEYIKESRQECTTSNDLFPCAKYRTLRYLTTLGDYYYSNSGNDSNPVRIIKMERLYNNGPDFFPTARQAPTDSEFTKFMKFAQRQANYYLGTQGLAVNLPEGAEVIENSLVGKKKDAERKKVTQVLLPLIMLLKLFKIKVMLAIVLASVLFIKKAVLLAAIILPSALQYLKQCASHSRHHHHAPYHFEHDDHDDGGYYGGYGKDYERAYNAYVKSRHSK